MPDEVKTRRLEQIKAELTADHEREVSLVRARADVVRANEAREREAFLAWWEWRKPEPSTSCPEFDSVLVRVLKEAAWRAWHARSCRVPCQPCEGTGKAEGDRCPFCRGEGYATEAVT